MARRALAILMLAPGLVCTIWMSVAMANSTPPSPGKGVKETNAAAVDQGRSGQPGAIARSTGASHPARGVLDEPGSSPTLAVVIVGTGLAIVGLTLVAVTRKEAKPEVHAYVSG